MATAIAGAKSRHGDAAAQLLVPLAFGQRRCLYPGYLHLWVRQQIVDMPAQGLVPGQVPGDPGFQIAAGAPCVNVVTREEIAASQRTCHNPHLLMHADV